MTNALLYATMILLWGTSWISIKFQLGAVAPEVSVFSRFVAAALVTFAVCLATRRPMRFALREHAFMAAQGLCVFSTNFVLIYLATQYLTSGLVAVVFSLITVVTIVEGALVFGFPIRRRVAAGAALGVAGLALVFWPEIARFDVTSEGALGLGLAVAGTTSAATGMLISARNQRHGIPVIQANAYGMAYGALWLGVVCLLRGRSFAFDTSATYVLSFLWLAVPCTVVAFWCYMTLVGRIGADRAAYSSVLYPIVALGISTVVEGYQWTMAAAAGLALVLAGNLLVIRERRPAVSDTGSRSR